MEVVFECVPPLQSLLDVQMMVGAKARTAKKVMAMDMDKAKIENYSLVVDFILSLFRSCIS